MIIVIDNFKRICYTQAEAGKKGRMRMERKLRHSRQRERIYEYLLASREHPSAEMIYDALRGEIPSLSLGTVYRNLKLLEELGKVRRVTSSQSIERYDACCSDHAHFVCSGCGCVRDLEIRDAEAVRAALMLDAGCRPGKIDLTVTGLCPDCAAG